MLAEASKYQYQYSNPGSQPLTYQNQKLTHHFQQLLLHRIQASVRLFSNALEVVVDDHLAEVAACSEQHGHVPIDAVAEGQHYDIWIKLGKELLIFPQFCLR